MQESYFSSNITDMQPTAKDKTINVLVLQIQNLEQTSSTLGKELFKHYLQNRNTKKYRVDIMLTAYF